MDFNPFFKLLETKEKNLLKSSLISFPCFYLVGYLYFPQISEFRLFNIIMIIAGISIMVISMFYLIGLFLGGKADFIYGYVTSISIAMSAFSILLGLLWGFNIAGFYIIISVIPISVIIALSIAFYKDRKEKAHKRTIDNQ